MSNENKNTNAQNEQTVEATTVATTPATDEGKTATEILSALMDTVRESMSDLCKLKNTMGSSDTKVNAAKKVLTAAVNAYNAKAAELAYIAWGTLDNALPIVYIPHAIKAQIKQDKNTGRYKGKISDDKIKMTLGGFRDAVGEEVFSNPEWDRMSQSLACIFALSLDKDLRRDGVDHEEFTYQMNEAFKLYNFGEGANIASKTSALKALQMTVDAIYFRPKKNSKGEDVNTIKAVNADWVYITNGMTGQSKEIGHVKVYSPEKMQELIVDVLYSHITGTPYQLENA